MSEICNLDSFSELYARLGNNEKHIWSFLSSQYIKVQKEIALIEQREKDLFSFYGQAAKKRINDLRNDTGLKDKHRYLRLLKYLISDTDSLEKNTIDIKEMPIKQLSL